MPKFLIGERIYMRAMEKEDLGAILEWVNDPEMRHLTQKEEFPVSRLRGEELFEKDKIFFAICLNDNRLIGFLNLTINQRNATLGITIDRSYWSKGYGKEATELALDYCFNTLNLHRVELWVFEFNERAIHLYEKLGFKKEGVHREAVYKKGKYWDVIDMGMLRDEWHKS